jgi:CRP-like cAMP-binding protein
MTTHLAEQEARLKELIRAGQTDQAIELLCRLASICARNNDFEKADAFRDQLYEVDSLALAAIVKVNEIIDAEKGKALTPDRRRLWANFFTGLSGAEVNAFFFALKELTLEGEQTLLQQGQANDRLYLLNKGQLKIVHEGQARQLLIHTLGAGDTCGEDTFYFINVCTASIITLGPSHLSYLERDRLEGLKIQFPRIENHLVRITGSGKRMYDWLRQKGMDRRAHKRFNLQAEAWFQVLTPDDTKALQRPVAVELWDISRSGLSFYFNSKNRQAVSRLVGRTLGIKFNLPVGAGHKEIAVTGQVQGVQNHPLDEYSVHVQLKRNFSVQAMQTIQRIAEG